MALYGLQLFDAMGPFISKQKAAVITTAVSQKVAVPMPIARRAIVGAPTQTFAVTAQTQFFLRRMDALSSLPLAWPQVPGMPTAPGGGLAPPALSATESG